MVVNQQTLHTSLGIVGNIASMLFFLSSTPTVLEMIKKKSSGGLSGDLYLLKLFNCLMWTFYGLPFIHPHDFWVVLTNAFGCMFSCCYIIPYALYASKMERINVATKLLVVLSSFVCMVLLLIVFDQSQSSRITIVGILCTVISSLMHMGLLSQCDKVITSKDSKYLHPNTSITGFIKGAIWLAYGIVDLDIYIMIPNGIGVLIGIIQTVIVIALYCYHQGTNDVVGEQIKEQVQEEKQPRYSFSILEVIRRNSSEVFLETIRVNSSNTFLENIMRRNSLESTTNDATKRSISFEMIPSSKMVKQNGSNFFDLTQYSLSNNISNVSSIVSIPRISNKNIVLPDKMNPNGSHV